MRLCNITTGKSKKYPPRGRAGETAKKKKQSLWFGPRPVIWERGLNHVFEGEKRLCSRSGEVNL